MNAALLRWACRLGIHTVTRDLSGQRRPCRRCGKRFDS